MGPTPGALILCAVVGLGSTGLSFFLHGNEGQKLCQQKQEQRATVRAYIADVLKDQHLSPEAKIRATDKALKFFPQVVC